MKLVARVALVFTAVLTLSSCGSAFAQYVPAGLQGTWKVKKNLSGKSVGCFDPMHTKMLMGAKLSLGEHELVWMGLHNINPSPKIEEVSSYAFSAKYGLAPHDLGLPATDKISILQVNPSEGIPINAVIALGPSTILIDACNIWLEAQHDGGYQETPAAP